MNNVPQVTPADVPAGAKIIDVREDYEWEGGHVAGAQHITLGTLTERLSELPSKDEEFYVICHGGGRSNRAAEYLRQNGYQAKKYCWRNKCLVHRKAAYGKRKRAGTCRRSLMTLYPKNLEYIQFD